MGCGPHLRKAANALSTRAVSLIPPEMQVSPAAIVHNGFSGSARMFWAYRWQPFPYRVVEGSPVNREVRRNRKVSLLSDRIDRAAFRFGWSCCLLCRTCILFHLQICSAAIFRAPGGTSIAVGIAASASYEEGWKLPALQESAPPLQ
jgi:hypothetical protein